MNAVMQSNVDTANFTSYTVDLNASTYKVLSDTLYSDKIGSIIREVCRNGADAHDMADIPDEPIDVTLPTTLNPYFVVKDHGLGLDEVEMDTVYRHYFRSTKENSFGLGAKSPHAYTDSFTITTIKNGLKLFYTSSLNDEGIPYVVKMGEERTTDHNGVEVKIPVKTGDIYKFSAKIYEQCAFFDTFPNIINGSGSFDEWKSTIWKQIGCIGLRDTDSREGGYRHSGYITFIVKKVGYRVALDSLQEHLTAKEFDFLTVIQDSYWFVPEIETTPSREAISFSPKTIELIKKVLHENHAKIKQELTAKFETITNKFERYAWILAHKRLAKGLDISMANAVGKEVSFDIAGGITLSGSAQANVVSIINHYTYRGRLTTRPWSTASVTLPLDLATSKLESAHKVLVTEKRLHKNRIKNYLTEYNLGNHKFACSDVTEIVVTDKAKFFVDLECDAPDEWFLSVDDFPLPPKAPKVAAAKIPKHRWEVINAYFSSARGVNRIFAPLDELEGYYVIVDSMGSANIIDSKHWQVYSKTDASLKKIYAIKVADLDKIDRSKLLDFHAEMDKTINKIMTPVNKVKAAVIYYIKDMIDYKEKGWSLLPNDIDDSDVRIMQKFIAMAESDKQADLHSLVNALNDYIGGVLSNSDRSRMGKKIRTGIKTLCERLHKKYPMMYDLNQRTITSYQSKNDPMLAECTWYVREKAKRLAIFSKV